MKRRNFLKSTEHKDYRKKRFRNPNAKKIIKRPWRLIIGGFIFCVAVLSVPFMLGYAPVFAFETVNVEGLTSVPESEVTNIIYDQMNQKRYKFFPQNNQFYFQDDLAYQQLQEIHDFAYLEINVEGRAINVKAEERIVELVWLSKEEFYFLDLDGKILSPLSETDVLQITSRVNKMPLPPLESEIKILQPNMPIIHDLHSETVELNQQMVPAEFVDNILELDKGLRRAGIEPVIYELEDVRSSSVRLKSRTSYDILVSASEDVDQQLEGLQVILSDYQDRLAELEYIDLRFGNHVFIK